MVSALGCPQAGQVMTTFKSAISFSRVCLREVYHRRCPYRCYVHPFWLEPATLGLEDGFLLFREAPHFGVLELVPIQRVVETGWIRWNLWGSLWSLLGLLIRIAGSIALIREVDFMSRVW
jgi:hypothetical protein